MKTLRQIENRVKKMDLDFDLIPAMDCYDKMVSKNSKRAEKKLGKIVKDFDLTVAEFIVWMTFDTDTI